MTEMFATVLSSLRVLFQKPIFFFVVVLLCGASLRLVHWGNMRVDFDQVQIIENATAILSKDFSLIGPKTGPAAMFTGPLIYYVAAPFVYLFGDFMTVVYVPLFFSVITGIALYWLTSTYVGKREGFIMLSLWAFSPFLIDLDRVLWNPNLTLLASALLVLPLLKPTANTKTPLFLFAGSFLAYQAHFSGFLLVLLGVLLVFYLRHPLKLALSIAGGLVVSLIPTLIFDIRNDFLNVRGLLSLFSSQGGRNIGHLAQDALHNTYILIETLGKIVLFRNSTPTIVTTGIAIAFTAIAFFRKEKIVSIAFLWCLAVALCFSMYGGPKPEYYFLIAVPPLLLLLTVLIKNYKQCVLAILLVFFGIHALYVSLNAYSRSSGMTVANIRAIQKYALSQPLKGIQYDMPFGSTFGITSFLSRIPLSEEGRILHVSHPHSLEYRGLQQVADVGLWVDKRNPDQDYVTTDAYFLTAKPGFFFYLNAYPRSTLDTYDVYAVVFEEQVVGQLSVASEKNDQEPWVKECLDDSSVARGVWTKKTEERYVYRTSGFCLEFRMSNSEIQQVGAMEIEIL